jgi:AcrR family transcriptional regulator
VTIGTREAIVDAALALVNEGDTAFSYEALASRAGVARQTVYAHFGDRESLLVAAVDRVREQLGADELVAPVYSATTAREALAALIEFHLAYTPQILVPSRAIEAERARNPAMSRAFERRPSGRRQVVRHVITRLQAEGDLDPEWTVDDATDLVSALTTAAFTSDLLEERAWPVDRLRERLLTCICRSLLIPRPEPEGT